MYSPSENNPFKSEGGVYYLKPIFYEHDLSENKDVAIYTLKDEDHTVGNKVYPSLRRLYIETGDLTEYQFVDLFLGGWTHWKKLQACTWFQPYLEDWREELEVKLRSEALAKVIDISKAKQHPSHYQAAKYVVDKGWQAKEKEKTGPKTREKIREEAEKIHHSNVEILEDWKRIKGEE